MPETIRAVEMSRIGNSKTGRPAGPSARRRESGPVERRRAENCREHAAVAVTAPEHAAKETQRRSRGPAPDVGADGLGQSRSPHVEHGADGLAGAREAVEPLSKTSSESMVRKSAKPMAKRPQSSKLRLMPMPVSMCERSQKRHAGKQRVPRPAEHDPAPDVGADGLGQSRSPHVEHGADGLQVAGARDRSPRPEPESEAEPRTSLPSARATSETVNPCVRRSE